MTIFESVRSSKWSIALIVALAALFHVGTASPYHNWGDDFAQYILHARNLVEGIPYADTGYMANTIDFGEAFTIGPKAYPPLTSLLLAPIYKFGGVALQAMKYGQVVFLIAAVLAALLYLRKSAALDSEDAALFCAALAFHPFLWAAKEQIGSDLLFLGLCFGALLTMETILKCSESRIWRPMLLGVLIYLAIATRTIGIVLLAMPLLASFLVAKPRRFYLLISLLPAALLLGFQSLWFHSDNSYMRMLIERASFSVLFTNAIGYVKELSSAFAFNSSPLSGQILYLASLPLVLVGAYRKLREGSYTFLLFAICYMGVIIVWPAFQGVRFLLPIFPIYLALLFAGAKRFSRYGGVMAAVAMVLVSLGYYRSHPPLQPNEGATQSEFMQLCDHIKRTTKPEDRFLFRKPRALALFSGRAAAAFNSNDNDANFQRLIDQLGIDYIVRATLPDYEFIPDKKTLAPYLERHPGEWKLTYSNSRFALYRSVPQP